MPFVPFIVRAEEDEPVMVPLPDISSFSVSVRPFRERDVPLLRVNVFTVTSADKTGWLPVVAMVTCALVGGRPAAADQLEEVAHALLVVPSHV